MTTIFAALWLADTVGSFFGTPSSSPHLQDVLHELRLGVERFFQVMVQGSKG